MNHATPPDADTLDPSQTRPDAESQSWRNLVFLKNGRSVLGFHAHPSEQAARAAIAEVEGCIQRFGPESGRIHIATGVIRATEFSHAFPVQWTCEP